MSYTITIRGKTSIHTYKRINKSQEGIANSNNNLIKLSTW